MQKTLFFVLGLSLCFQAQAQTIAEISRSICDSLNATEYADENQQYMAQLGIYAYEVMKYPRLVVDITDMNKPHQFNEFNYKINRDLLRNCEGFRDQFTLLPLSKILDLEMVLNNRQYDSLENALVSFINAEKLNLVIVSADDVFPYPSLGEYARFQAMKWNVGGRYEKGGILFVFNSKSNEMDYALISKSNEEGLNLKFQHLLRGPFHQSANRNILKELLLYLEKCRIALAYD